VSRGEEVARDYSYGTQREVVRQHAAGPYLARQLSAFRPRGGGGSLDRRLKLSLRVPAQMGWREMEHKGENVARVILRPGDALVVGVTSVHKRERVSLFVSGRAWMGRRSCSPVA
jgi:hypothetical protein